MAIVSKEEMYKIYEELKNGICNDPNRCKSLMTTAQELYRNNSITGDEAQKMLDMASKYCS